MLNHLFAWLFSFHDFSICSKTSISSTRNQVNEESLCGCATSESLFFFFLLILWLNYKAVLLSGWGGGRGGGQNLCSLKDGMRSWPCSCMGMWCIKKSLPEENIIHVLIIEWTYSSWYKNKCFVLSWYHILSRTAISIRYVFFFKIVYYRFCKVTMTTNKEQNVWNIRTKVSNETCSSGRLPY